MDLFQSCRRGDLDRVRYLVENGETELNLRDHWDSTPLYYACLCGHHELVEFLLQNGEVVLIANRFNTGFVTTCALSKRRKMRMSHADTDLTGYYSRF